MSSYRGDLSPSDRADIESFTEAPCKWCGGSGWMPATPSAGPQPCGCEEAAEVEAEETEWRPLATVPRDGSWVRLKGPWTKPEGEIVRWAPTGVAVAPHAATDAALVQMSGSQPRGMWLTREGWLAAFVWTHWAPVEAEVNK